MGVSFEELRERCQRPVRARNDVSGLLLGDHLSLPLTKVFVDLGLSPTIATVGMLVCGVAGALLQFAAEGWAVLGAALLVLYYVLDCVDGEVARYRRIEDIRWGYFDYLFHIVVKPLTYAGVGVGLHHELGHVAALWAALAAAIAVLWLKFLHELPRVQFVVAVLQHHAAPFRVRPYRRFVSEALRQPPPETAPATFRLGLDRTTLRAAATNFDIGLCLLLAATVGDLMLEPFTIAGFGPVTLRALWLGYYALIVPYDFVDYLRTYLRRDDFGRQMVDLLRRSHAFDLEEYDRAAQASFASDADEPLKSPRDARPP